MSKTLPNMCQWRVVLHMFDLEPSQIRLSRCHRRVPKNRDSMRMDPPRRMSLQAWQLTASHAVPTHRFQCADQWRAGRPASRHDDVRRITSTARSWNYLSRTAPCVPTTLQLLESLIAPCKSLSYSQPPTCSRNRATITTLQHTRVALPIDLAHAYTQYGLTLSPKDRTHHEQHSTPPHRRCP